jgi:hypothetical protein
MWYKAEVGCGVLFGYRVVDPRSKAMLAEFAGAKRLFEAPWWRVPVSDAHQDGKRAIGELMVNSFGEPADRCLDTLHVFHRVHGKTESFAEGGDEKGVLVGVVFVEACCRDGGEKKCDGHLAPSVRRAFWHPRVYPRC